MEIEIKKQIFDVLRNGMILELFLNEPPPQIFHKPECKLYYLIPDDIEALILNKIFDYFKNNNEYDMYISSCNWRVLIFKNIAMGTENIAIFDFSNKPRPVTMAEVYVWVYKELQDSK